MIFIENLLNAYTNGFFPMADSDTNEIKFYSPFNRAIFPIYDIKPHKSVKQFIRRNTLEITINNNFPFVISACADRKEVWISDQIIDWYTDLHKYGFAHSIEVWNEDVIIGGLYGVSIGAAFFGESMFSCVSNASKVAFYFLVEYLKERKFKLLDSQFINDHTKLLGAIEVTRNEYLQMLEQAIKLKRTFI